MIGEQIVATVLNEVCPFGFEDDGVEGREGVARQVSLGVTNRPPWAGASAPHDGTGWSA